MISIRYDTKTHEIEHGLKRHRFQLGFALFCLRISAPELPGSNPGTTSPFFLILLLFCPMRLLIHHPTKSLSAFYVYNTTTTAACFVFLPLPSLYRHGVISGTFKNTKPLRNKRVECEAEGIYTVLTYIYTMTIYHSTEQGRPVTPSHTRALGVSSM